MTETIIRPFNVGGSPLTKSEVLMFENDVKRIFGGSKNFKKPGCRRANGSFDGTFISKLSDGVVDLIAVNFVKSDTVVEGVFYLDGYELDMETYAFSMTPGEFGDFIAKVFCLNLEKARKQIRSLKGKSVVR